MEYLFCYLVAGIAIGYAVDSRGETTGWETLAVILLWLPIIVIIGTVERRNRG